MHNRNFGLLREEWSARQRFDALSAEVRRAFDKVDLYTGTHSPTAARQFLECAQTMIADVVKVFEAWEGAEFSRAESASSKTARQRDRLKADKKLRPERFCRFGGCLRQRQEFGEGYCSDHVPTDDE
jgi:hypothetical protein